MGASKGSLSGLHIIILLLLITRYAGSPCLTMAIGICNSFLNDTECKAENHMPIYNISPFYLLNLYITQIAVCHHEANCTWSVSVMQLQPPAGFPIHFANGKPAVNVANHDDRATRCWNHYNCLLVN